MGRQYKTSHKVYSAWNYEKEIEDLNKASQEGWQLVKGGCFSSKFKKNANVCYRYQLDYQPNVEDMGRYIETFREQGWEYINSTFNGWHYFRKVYDASLPEEQYEIFTDRSSLQEMNGRWAKLATGLSIVIAIFLALETVCFVREPALPTCIRLITLAVLLFVFVRAILIMRNPDKKKNVRWDGLLLAIFFIVLIVGNAGSLYLNAIRPDFDSEYVAENIAPIPEDTKNALVWDSIAIAYSDNYYMDLEIAADSPVCVSLVSESGEAVYTVAESSFAKEDIKLQLKKGVYKIYLSDYAGGKLDVKLEVD